MNTLSFNHATVERNDQWRSMPYDDLHSCCQQTLLCCKRVFIDSIRHKFDYKICCTYIIVCVDERANPLSYKDTS